LVRLSTRTRAYEILSNSAGADRDYFAGVVFSRSLEIMIKSGTNKMSFRTSQFPCGLGSATKFHDLLRCSDWIRAYRTTAELFDRKLVASGEPQ
jgi:hypothetical protein